MGYRCPVCGHPQADGGHLANHLAFTAIIRGGDHESWLDDHVDDWDQFDEETLAERVVPEAQQTEYPQVFEDTTADSDARSGVDHATGTDGERSHDSNLPDDVSLRNTSEVSGIQTGLDREAREILDAARELTRRRRENTTDRDSNSGDGEEDGNASEEH